MVQGFVQQSGGVIDAQSTPGKGTSLRLYLPRAPITRDVDTEFAPQRRSADAEGRILLVEDDDAVRDSLRMLLEISGYSVIEAADGETALDLFETESFALVLTDIALPGGKDGREIARLVRAKNPNLPFVFISGYAEEIELMARNLRPGDQLLAKPFDPDVLEAMINQALAG
ncbi:MAG: response regulator [Alphaproteobacteria bacterium]|nr:response regulator [Alphaproteobacteria bacterium]